jgi:iron complex transport system substrate-binding protein
VISVVPAATEIITALGACDTLVGVSHECMPDAGAASPARVTASTLGASIMPREIDAEVAAAAGSGRPLFTLDADAFDALRPDLIITQGLCDVCAVSEHDVRALAARLASTPRVVSISASTLEGVFDDIATIADALGLRADGDRLVSGLRARMRRIHDVLSAARAPRPRVAVLEWTDPPFAAGHWVAEMIYRAGGTDVLGVTGQHSREITWDALTDSAPAVVLIAPCGYGLDRSALEGQQLIASNACIDAFAVWALDARRLISQPGPGLVEGIEVMAAIFNPHLFETPATSRAVLLAPATTSPAP